ncbi:hybrid sensor histidine kinase/response regulator [Pseudarthrobacter sp. N5]|uniref:hybrid sensor histidine kinase/response regulator n=1 Tax=Pseudarthrobacter sp. N5 TaxID=3418416 RepID=UPI003CF4B22A
MSVLGLGQVRELFAQEAEVRLADLDQLLLQLEQAGGDETLIRSVFRELHTLKGSAAVAGLDEVSEVAHGLEEIVDGLRAGRQRVTPEIIDTLLAGADRLGHVIAGTLGTAEPSAAVSRRESPAVSEPPTGGRLAAVDRCTVRPALEPAEAQRPHPTAEASGAGDSGGVVMVPMERLDEMVRLIGESASAHLRVGRMLMEKYGADPTLNSEFNDLSRTLNELQDRAMRTRMVPLASITDKLQRAVRDLSRTQGKTIHWDVRGSDTELDRGVLVQLSDSLLHIVRNAVDHGIESDALRTGAGKPAGGIIRLHAMQLGSEVIIAVTDDGNGIDTGRIREQAEHQGIDTDGMSQEDILHLVFHPGLSTRTFVTAVSGRGVGLDVVRASVEAAHGRIEVRSKPGLGTEFRIIVPITLAVLRCLLVESGGQRFALPFHRVVLSQRYDPSSQSSAEGRPVLFVEDLPVPVSNLAGTLGLVSAEQTNGPVVVLADTARRHAFQVDRLVGQRDVVVKALNGLLAHLPAVAGASVEPDGSVLIVLDPPGLIQRARHSGGGEAPKLRESPSTGSVQRILVVDDALTIRELQRSILERAGFDVRVAVDGMDALSKLAEEASDLILTDIEMPNMDGFELTEAVRAHPSLANIPVLILSSRSSAPDRQRGLDAGADGFILKSSFDEGSLLMAVNRLIGARA